MEASVNCSCEIIHPDPFILMNFLPGTLKRDGAGAQVQFADGASVAAPTRVGKTASA